MTHQRYHVSEEYAYLIYVFVFRIHTVDDCDEGDREVACRKKNDDGNRELNFGARRGIGSSRS